MIDELTASFSSTVENHSFSPPAKKKPIGKYSFTHRRQFYRILYTQYNFFLLSCHCLLLYNNTIKLANLHQGKLLKLIVVNFHFFLARVTSPYVPAEEPKQKECVDVETQTPVQEPPSVKPISIVRKETDNTAPECVTDKQQVEEPPPPPPVAVFAEKPLETMRKNRLMILLGGENTLGNSSSIVSTAPDSLKETTFPVSILTTKKSPHKSEKHVTFNIPSTTEGSGENVALGSDKITPVCVVTTTTVSLVTPIVFPSVSEASISTSSFNSANTSNNILQIAVSDAIAVATTSFQSKSAFNTTDSLNSSFGIPAQNPPSASNNLNVVTTTASSQFVFNSPDSKTTFSSSIPTLPAASTSSGGFKFDLKEAKSNDIKTTVASESAVTTSSFFSMPPNNVTVSNPVAINVTVTTSSTPSFSFIATSTAAPPPTVGFSFPAPASTSSGFTLPGNTLVPSFTVAPTTSTLAPSFTLPKATAANTTKGFSFANNTNSLIGFSAPSTTAIPIAPIGGFNMPAVSTNAPTTTSGFAFTTPPSTSAFGFNKSDPVTTKTGFAFGSTNFSSTTAPNPITSSFINAPSAITTNAAFQSETPNFSFSSNMTNAPLFPSFGASATAATSTFTNTLSTFGFMTNNTKPSFNTTITSTAAPPLFSTTPATTVPTPFTVPKQASSSINFGFIKTDNNAFGTTNPPQSLFDTTKTLPTPATTASVFAGNVVQSPFAPTANKPVFGFSATTPNIPAFPSGSSSIVPGVTKDVGATPKNIFGSFATTSTPAFGTAQTSAFPSTTTNQFSFGNTAFKPNALPFATGKEIGVTTAPAVAFGQTSTFSTSFGAGGGAVSSQKSASFGPNTNNNNAFGSKSFPATTQPSSDVFTFGSNAPSAGVFSFGASEPPRAATFNFGADNNSNNNVFGTNQAFATAAPQAPSFGAGNTNNNTQAAAVPGMFNIGTGFTPSGRQRLQLRAKRRT